MKALAVIVASLVLWAGVGATQTITVEVTVTGSAGPWLWVNGGLNTAYQYEYPGYHDFTAPTVVSGNDGFRFTAGDALTISYVSGLVSVGPATGWPWVDANGVTGRDSSGYLYCPSNYMNPPTGNLMSELVGTFANSSGQIVGTPFAIGNLGTFTIPTGATRLQLGVNDSLYYDDAGSWNIDVTGIPEPTTATLVLIALGGLGLTGRRCRRSVAR
jgi:hypothetical protein